MEKLKTLFSKLKGNWKTPPKGYFVSYKEFLYFALGQGSNSFLGVIMGWTAVAISTPMMISYFKISTGFVFVSGIAGSIIGLIRAPLLSMIIDNSNSKRGKFKPFLPVSAILTAICFSVIPFIPEAWIERNVLSFSVPSIPILGVSASQVDISLGVLVMFALIQTGSFFSTLLAQCLVGIEQVITPVSQERANIGALKGLVANLPSSIVNIIIPLVAGIIFASSDNPMNNIALYRGAFPICSVLGVVFVFFIYFGVEERTVVDKEFTSRVKFFEGAKVLFLNKYFWIITIYNIIVAVRGNINMYLWICNYAIGGQKGAFALTICNIVLNNALIPGMLVGPFIIKRLGKRKVMLISSVGFTVMAFLQLFTISSPYLMLVAIFMQNLFQGLYYVVGIMTPDVLDYIQYKTGKRLEGFWQNSNAFVTTICGFFTSALMPIFMSIGGIGFGDNVDVALKDKAIMTSTFESVTWLGIIASVLCIIPFVFYNLTERKHEDYIKALKIRAAVTNFENGKLTDEDKANIKELVDFAKEEKDEFVTDELSRHSVIDEIYALS